MILGDIDSAVEAYGEFLGLSRTLLKVEPKDFLREASITHVLLEALVKSISKRLPHLQTNYKNLLSESESYQIRIKGQICYVHDAVVLYFRRIGAQNCVVLKPTVKGTLGGSTELPEDVDKELKRVTLTYQYNDKFDSAFKKWKKILCAKTAVYELPGQTSVQFVMHGTPVYASVSSSDPKHREVVLSKETARLVNTAGVQLPEPALLFSDQQGSRFVQDTSPMRGIIRNRPYDYALTKSALNTSTKLGIICCKADERLVHTFINSLANRASVDSKSEYLVDYPGYAQAFGIPLDVPLLEDTGWYSFPDPNQRHDTKSGLLYLYKEIIRGIENINSVSTPTVIVIYIPSNWKAWEAYIDESERLDLHDMVKAYCVQKGIATQFLRQETLTKGTKCEIRWWLGLSLYVKSRRTPWTIAGTDSSTAFVGIGYALDSVMSGDKRKIILGCSHIYGSDGLGLQYKVSKIENPIFRRGNPHMSREDAHQVGEMIRQQFYESKMSLPNRVVFHKNSPFSEDEQVGLLEGMQGVEHVDMVEIRIENAVRYLASHPLNNGKFDIDKFPIRRGTCLVLDHNRAFIWAHGTADATTGNLRYYQGKSRIPAPLTLKRYHGESNLSVIANEVLGLSKMDWNTFDMYTKMPATIHSSSRIARIGSYIQEFKTMSYDYRLFM